MFEGRSFVFPLVLLLFAAVLDVACVVSVLGAEEHVYYGYVPPSRDVYNVNAPNATEAGRVQEMIKGKVVDYYVPSGSAVLDIVGIEDGTYFEITNIYTGEVIAADTVDKFEKKHFFIPFGTFFKITSTKRIGALLTGGAQIYEPDGRPLAFRLQGITGGEPPGGTSLFYPAVTGGFRGREFIFVAAPPTHPFGYSKDLMGYNFYLVALEEADWMLKDSIDSWSQSGHIAPRSNKQLMIQSRCFYASYAQTHGGGGSDVVFHVETTGDVIVACSGGIDDFFAVPAVTGGFVGKIFVTPLTLSAEQEGRTAAFVVLPLEACEVKVYNKDLGLIASRSFTTDDVSKKSYWYYSLGRGRFDLIVESTGNICFMAGKTKGGADMECLGDDITFMGAGPNQEIRFYAPATAILFAPEDLSVSIDGGAPIKMSKDEFRLIESGVHSVKADKHIIVEILATGGGPALWVDFDVSGWTGWGSYLIEQLDVDKTFEIPEKLLKGAAGADYTNYIIIAGIAAIVVAAAVITIKMRRQVK
jgi:hypothetical protein